MNRLKQWLSDICENASAVIFQVSLKCSILALMKLTRPRRKTRNGSTNGNAPCQPNPHHDHPRNHRRPGLPTARAGLRSWLYGRAIYEFAEMIERAVIPPHLLKLMSRADRESFGRDGMLPVERKAELDATLEASTHNQFIQWCNLHGIFYIHSNMRKKSTTTKGLPDFCIAIDGQAVAVEFKTMDGSLSEDQEKAIDKMRGGINQWRVEVCTSLEQAIAFVGRFRK